MSRVRLTKKIQANDPSDMDGSRQKIQPKIDTYSDFDPAKEDVGDRKVKMWKEDPKLRDEMHVTKIKQAKMWQASKLATKLAIYLLGEKAPSNMVKAQAAEFLPLGNARLARAVSRFAKTEYLYAEEVEEVEAPEETVAEDKVEAPVESEKEVEKPVEEVEAPVQEDKSSEAETEEAGVDDEPADETEEASDEIDSDEDLVEEAEEDDKVEDISDAEIASIFASNSNDVVTNKSANKSQKKGVQTMVQPSRVASSQNYMSELWAGAPDVSDIF